MRCLPTAFDAAAPHWQLSPTSRCRAQLRDLDLKELWVGWRNAFGKPAPKHLTRYLLDM